MNATSPDFPWLPHELIEKIIQSTWDLPLSNKDRSAFMTSSLLVNKTWMVAFIRVSSTDVYFPCPSYEQQWQRMLSGRLPIFSFLPYHVKKLPRRLCRSLNFLITKGPKNAQIADVGVFNEIPLAQTLRVMLNRLTAYGLPNLHRLSLHYHDRFCDEPTDSWRFSERFPKQITEVEMNYTYSPDMVRSDEAKKKALGLFRGPQYHDIEWTLPSVKRLAIFGANKDLVKRTVERSPVLETLTTDLKLASDEYEGVKIKYSP